VQRRRFSRATWLASLQLAVARTSKWVKLRWSRKKDPFDLAGDHRDHQGPPGTTRDHRAQGARGLSEIEKRGKSMFGDAGYVGWFCSGMVTLQSGVFPWFPWSS